MGGACRIRPAAGLAKGKADGGFGERYASVYACSVCGGTEAIRAYKVAGSLVRRASSASSPSMPSPGEGVSIGPAGGGEFDPASDGRPWNFNCDDKSTDGAGVCCCFGGNWKCCNVSAVATVVEGPASTTGSDFLEKKPNTIGDGG